MAARKAHFTALKSAARTASPADVVIDFGDGGVSQPQMDNIRNMHIIIDATSITDTPSVQFAILATDPTSGKTYDLLSGIAAITATGTTILKVGRDIVAAAGFAAQDFIPENVTLKFTHADADSITYSVGVNAEFDTFQ